MDPQLPCFQAFPESSLLLWVAQFLWIAREWVEHRRPPFAHGLSSWPPFQHSDNESGLFIIPLHAVSWGGYMFQALLLLPWSCSWVSRYDWTLACHSDKACFIVAFSAFFYTLCERVIVWGIIGCWPLFVLNNFVCVQVHADLIQEVAESSNDGVVSQWQVVMHIGRRGRIVLSYCVCWLVLEEYSYHSMTKKDERWKRNAKINLNVCGCFVFTLSNMERSTSFLSLPPPKLNHSPIFFGNAYMLFIT